MKIRMLLCSLLLTAASAFAADVDGKWSGNLDTPNGPVTLSCSFKAEGSTLTGTVTGPDGAEVKIANGKVTGDKISFDMTVDFGGMPITIAYTGTVMGANLTLTLDFAGMPFQIAMKKLAA